MIPDAIFDGLGKLSASGRSCDVIRRSKELLPDACDNEKAALLLLMMAAHQQIGEEGKAEACRTALAELKISEPEIKLNVEFSLATAWSEKGQYLRAAAEFRRLLRRHEREFQAGRYRYMYEDVECRMGGNLALGGRHAEAIPHLRQASSFRFEDPLDEQLVRLHLAACLEQTGDVSSAKVELVRIAKLGPSNPPNEQALWRLGSIHHREGDMPAAIACGDAILRDFPAGEIPRQQVHALLMDAYRRMGDYASAARHAPLARPQ